MLTPNSAYRKDKTTTTQLQHRHFAFIAKVISNLSADNCEESDCKARVAAAFAEACGNNNPRFDYARFLRACGLEG